MRVSISSVGYVGYDTATCPAGAGLPKVATINAGISPPGERIFLDLSRRDTLGQ